jgi:hypothetical protein
MFEEAKPLAEGIRVFPIPPQVLYLELPESDEESQPMLKFTA